MSESPTKKKKEESRDQHRISQASRNAAVNLRSCAIAQSELRQYSLNPMLQSANEMFPQRTSEPQGLQFASSRSYRTTITPRQKSFLAETIKPNSDEMLDIIIARQGPPMPGVPALLMVGPYTEINQGRINFASNLSELDVGRIVAVTAYETANESTIVRIPQPEHRHAFAIQLLDRYSAESVSALTLLTFVQHHPTRPSKICFLDTVAKQDRLLRKSLVKALVKSSGISAQNMKKGMLFRVNYMKYSSGTRYMPMRNIFFSKSVTTPIEGSHETVPAESSVAAIVDVVYEKRQDLSLTPKEDTAAEWSFIGEKMQLALGLSASARSQERREATIVTVPKWEKLNDGMVTKIWCEHSCEASQMQAAAACYAAGSMLLLRLGENYGLQSAAPASFVVSDVSFDEIAMRFSLTATAMTESVEMALGAGFIKTLGDKPVQIFPGASSGIGMELAVSLLRGKMNPADETKPMTTMLNIFKGVFGLEVPKIEETFFAANVELENEALTSDQQQVIKEILSGCHPIVRCEAPAGSGKTTMIAEICREIADRQSSTHKMILLLVSTANAPIVHASRALSDMPLPPLVLASTMAIARRTKEVAPVDEQCTLLGHFERLRRRVDLEPRDSVTVQKAYEGELEAKKKRDFIVNEAALRDLAPPEETQEASDDDEAYRPSHKALRKVMRQSSFDIAAGMEVLLRVQTPPLIAATTAMAFRYANLLKKHVSLVIIDEASTVPQIHAAALLAKFNSVTKLVLLGDSRQLPIYSRNLAREAVQMGFESVFTVLKKNTSAGIGHNVLGTTFRFHPEMVKMVQQIVYPDLQLTSGVISEARQAFSMFQPKNTSLPVLLLAASGIDYRVFPISRANSVHTKQTVKALQAIVEATPPTTLVAVICLYNAQRAKIIQAASKEVNNRVTYASVDSFQGQEADIVVLVTTKTLDVGNNEFLRKEERRNVALTRAKSGMVIVGDPAALRQNDTWRELVDYLKQADTIVTSIHASTTSMASTPSKLDNESWKL